MGDDPKVIYAHYKQHQPALKRALEPAVYSRYKRNEAMFERFLSTEDLERATLKADFLPVDFEIQQAAQEPHKDYSWLGNPPLERLLQNNKPTFARLAHQGQQESLALSWTEDDHAMISHSASDLSAGTVKFDKFVKQVLPTQPVPNLPPMLLVVDPIDRRVGGIFKAEGGTTYSLLLQEVGNGQQFVLVIQKAMTELLLELQSTLKSGKIIVVGFNPEYMIFCFKKKSKTFILDA
jgi:hypothetical protein